MKFKKGDVVQFKPNKKEEKRCVAKPGALAIVENDYPTVEDEKYVYIKWIRTELAGDQYSGGYAPEDFAKVEVG